MKDLILEKRGCDFWKDSFERKTVKDFDNFRYCGWVSRKKKIFVEITFSAHKKSKYSKIQIVRAYLDFEFENKNGSFRDLNRCGYCEPTKAEVLKFINIRYNRHFKDIKIVDNINNY